jgi:hypothetical protein
MMFNPLWIIPAGCGVLVILYLLTNCPRFHDRKKEWFDATSLSSQETWPTSAATPVSPSASTIGRRVPRKMNNSSNH